MQHATELKISTAAVTVTIDCTVPEVTKRQIVAQRPREELSIIVTAVAPKLPQRALKNSIKINLFKQILEKLSHTVQHIYNSEVFFRINETH